MQAETVQVAQRSDAATTLANHITTSTGSARRQGSGDSAAAYGRPTASHVAAPSTERLAERLAQACRGVGGGSAPPHVRIHSPNHRRCPDGSCPSPVLRQPGSAQAKRVRASPSAETETYMHPRPGAYYPILLRKRTWEATGLPGRGVVGAGHAKLGVAPRAAAGGGVGRAVRARLRGLHQRRALLHVRGVPHVGLSAPDTVA